MVAIVILMVGMLGLLQAINIAIETNVRNQIREEGVNVGQRVINDMRDSGFDNISVASTATDSFMYSKVAVPSKFRGIFRMYSVQRSSKVIHFFVDSGTASKTPATKRLEVLVTWKYRGVGYENRVVSNISRQFEPKWRIQ